MKWTRKKITQLTSTVMGLIVLVLLIAWMSGFFIHKTPPGRTPLAQPAVSGRLVPVEVREVPRYMQAAGSIRAAHETTVASRLLARVRRVAVTAGQRVEAGDLLAELDQADLQARLLRARANVDAAKARLDQAQSDLEKITHLQDQGAATARELDDALRNRNVIQADLAASQQSLAEAQSELDYATIRSPIDGIVIDKLIEEGDLAKPGQSLVTLYDPKRLQLEAPVPERVAVGLAVGQSVGVRIDAIDLRCEARISEIVPQAAPGSRSMLVKVTGPCPPGVYSGMFGRLLIPQGTRQQLLIPAAAVRRVGQLEMVTVVGSGDDPSTETRYIVTGETPGDQVEVLAGLAPNEHVLLPSN